MNTRVPRQLELPSNFIPEGAPEYVPPATHSETEAERRSKAHAGQLVIAQQHLGALLVSSYIKELITQGSVADRRFGSQVVTAAMFGSARLSLRGGDPVMRRHLTLPLLADPETDNRLDDVTRYDSTLKGLDAIVAGAYRMNAEISQTGSIRLRTAHKFGHIAGNVALWVSLLPHMEVGTTGTPYNVQHEVRKIGMDSLEMARELGEEIGAQPSLAMLAGPQANELNSYIYRKSPHGAYRALQTAKTAVRATLSSPQ